MGNKKRLALKIIAALLALILIGVMFFLNGFVGNPISKAFANKAIKEYLEQNYSSLDLEVEKPVYNFKIESYIAKVTSHSSKDTHFSVYYKAGKVTKDDYETDVLGMFNTRERLAQEYSLLAQNILAGELGYEGNRTRVWYKYKQEPNEILQLDMPFDRHLPLEAEVNLQHDLEDISLEGIAQVFIDAHQTFIENDCVFYKYGLYSAKDDTIVSVYGVLPEDIESGELLSILEETEKYKDDNDQAPLDEREKDAEERITIFRKSAS